MRAPYLQQIEATTAQVLWTSRDPQPATVEVTRPDGRVVVRVAARLDASSPTPEGQQYVAKLTGLRPGTQYCYRILDSDGPQVERTGFRTAPAPGSGKPVRFVAWGDSGEQSSDQAGVLDAMRTVPFDLMLNTGDLAGNDGTLDQYEETYFQPLAGIIDRVPAVVTIGNHEYGTERGQPFWRVFSLPENGPPDAREQWYSVDYGDIHVVSLDTNVINGERLQWLDADLAANNLPWTFVLMHHPPYSAGKHGGEKSVREAGAPILEKHKVPVAFVGHDHHYERTQPINGATYVVTGGGGRGTRGVGKEDHTAFAERVAHFVYGSVEGDELKLWAIDATGQEFDTVLIRSPK